MKIENKLMNLIIFLTTLFSVLNLGKPAQTCDLVNCNTGCCDINNHCAQDPSDCNTNCEKSCKTQCCVNGVCQESSDPCSKDSSILYFAAAIAIGLFIICIACIYRQRRILEQRRRTAQYLNQIQNAEHGPNNNNNNFPTIHIPPNANIAKGQPVVVEKPTTFEISNIEEIPYAENSAPIVHEEEIKIDADKNIVFSNNNSPGGYEESDNILRLNNTKTNAGAKMLFSPEPLDLGMAIGNQTANPQDSGVKEKASPESKRGTDRPINNNSTERNRGEEGGTNRTNKQETARDPAGFIPAPNFEEDEDENLFS